MIAKPLHGRAAVRAAGGGAAASTTSTGSGRDSIGFPHDDRTFRRCAPPSGVPPSLCMMLESDWLSRFMALVVITGKLEIRCAFGAPWAITYERSPACEIP